MVMMIYLYINDLPDSLKPTVKLFADDTSLFSTVSDPNMPADQLDNDLKKNQNGHTNRKSSLIQTCPSNYYYYYYYYYY